MSSFLVGLTQSWYPNSPEDHQVFGKWKFGLNQTYAGLTDRERIVPVAMVPTSRHPDGILRMLDLLILTGGGDPDPGLYGQPNNGSRSCSTERPVWEMDLYRRARELHVPALGICLGLQLIAMAEGVALIQDIQTSVEGALDHYGTPRSPKVHPVNLVPGSFLHGVLGPEAVVSSFHHQAAAAVPRGYRLTAGSSDGLIEGMESEDGEVIAVQWHPERDFTGSLLIEAMLASPKGTGGKE